MEVQLLSLLALHSLLYLHPFLPNPVQESFSPGDTWTKPSFTRKTCKLHYRFIDCCRLPGFYGTCFCRKRCLYKSQQQTHRKHLQLIDFKIRNSYTAEAILTAGGTYWRSQLPIRWFKLLSTEQAEKKDELIHFIVRTSPCGRVGQLTREMWAGKYSVII